MAVWAIALNENFTEVSDAVFGFLTEDFGWLYLVAIASIAKALAHDKDTPPTSATQISRKKSPFHPANHPSHESQRKGSLPK